MRLVGWLVGVGAAFRFGLRPDWLWLAIAAAVVEVVTTGCRILGLIKMSPRTSLTIDLYAAALTAAVAATLLSVPAAVLGTFCVAWVVLPRVTKGFVAHTATALTIGLALNLSLPIQRAEASRVSIALVVVLVIVSVFIVIIIGVLWLLRQTAASLRIERDLARASLTATLNMSKISLMVIDAGGTVLSSAGWSTLDISMGQDYRQVLESFPTIVSIVEIALDESEVHASVIDGERVLSVVASRSDELDRLPVISLAVSDITEPVHASRRATEESRWKTNFIATVSHEIRTPLTAVLGFADQLEPEIGGISADVDEYLAILTEQAREAADIVEDLLVATRHEMGELRIGNDHLNLMTDADQVVRGMSRRTRSIEVIGDATTVAGDRTRTRQIVRNLVSNARKYGGPRIEVHIYAQEGWGCLDVRDDGAGIPKAQRHRLFSPYFQVGQRSSPDGFGLGLYVSSSLARAMGGSLAYDYHHGWSVFRLRLPLVAETHQRAG